MSCVEASWLDGFETDWMDTNAVVTKRLIFQPAKGLGDLRLPIIVCGPRLPMMALKCSKTSLAHPGLL